MAISVDTVYKTVLLILNKEQRGYMTPDEFNKIATQVQLETFENYFESLNQQLRVPDNDSEYADRIKNIDEKIAIFKEYEARTYDTGGYFTLPDNLYRLGTVIYKDEIEAQLVQRNDLLYVNQSPLTKPTEQYPLYLYEDNKLYLKPQGKLPEYNGKVAVEPSCSLSWCPLYSKQKGHSYMAVSYFFNGQGWVVS